MESYTSLIKILKERNNQHNNDKSFKNKSFYEVNNFDIFDILVWKLNIDKRTFTLVSSDFGEAFGFGYSKSNDSNPYSQFRNNPTYHIDSFNLGIGIGVGFYNWRTNTYIRHLI